MLTVFAGLPGTGKSTIARELARDLGAVWLRIDSIEQALRLSGAMGDRVDGAGYEVAYRVAEDDLLLGCIVIGDSVNPWELTRNAWRDVGVRCGADVLEVEIVCSDVEEHRCRVETRRVEAAGLKAPSWRDVIERDYHPWRRDRLVLDTADQTQGDCVEQIRAALPSRRY